MQIAMDAERIITKYLDLKIKSTVDVAIEKCILYLRFLPMVNQYDITSALQPKKETAWLEIWINLLLKM